MSPFRESQILVPLVRRSPLRRSMPSSRRDRGHETQGPTPLVFCPMVKFFIEIQFYCKHLDALQDPEMVKYAAKINHHQTTNYPPAPAPGVIPDTQRYIHFMAFFK